MKATFLLITILLCNHAGAQDHCAHINEQETSISPIHSAPDIALKSEEEAIHYLKQSSLVTETDSSKLLSILHLKAKCLLRLNRTQEATQLLRLALKYAEKNNFFIEASRIHRLLAFMATSHSNYRDGFTQLYLSLKFADAAKDSTEYIKVIRQIGSLFFELKDFERALFYYSEVSSLLNRKDNHIVICQAHCLVNLNRPEETLNALSELQCNSDEELMTSSFVLGVAYLKMNRLSQALEKLGVSLRVAKRLKYTKDKTEALLNIARVHLKNQKFALALPILNEAHTNAIRHGYYSLDIEIVTELIDLFKQTRNYKRVLAYQDILILSKENSYSGKMARDVALIEGHLAESKHQRQIEIQRRQLSLQNEILKGHKVFWIGSILALFLLIIFIVLQVIRIRLENRINKVLKEKVLSRTAEIQQRSEQFRQAYSEKNSVYEKVERSVNHLDEFLKNVHKTLVSPEIKLDTRTRIEKTEKDR